MERRDIKGTVKRRSKPANEDRQTLAPFAIRAATGISTSPIAIPSRRGPRTHATKQRPPTLQPLTNLESQPRGARAFAQRRGISSGRRATRLHRMPPLPPAHTPTFDRCKLLDCVHGASANAGSAPRPHPPRRGAMSARDEARNQNDARPRFDGAPGRVTGARCRAELVTLFEPRSRPPPLRQRRPLQPVLCEQPLPTCRSKLPAHLKIAQEPVIVAWIAMTSV